MLEPSPNKKRPPPLRINTASVKEPLYWAIFIILELGMFIIRGNKGLVVLIRSKI